MPIEPEIRDDDAFCLASIPIEIEAARIREVMGPTLAELRRVVADQDMPATGPWMTHHWRRPTDRFVFDVCLPTPRPVTATGRVRPDVVAAQKVAWAAYIGEYSGLAGAWNELSRWIAAQGVETRADFYEIYVLGPDSGLPPGQWRTELVCPLV